MMLKKILATLIILVSFGIVFLLGLIFLDCFQKYKSSSEPKYVNITGHSQSEYEFDTFDEEYEVYENDSLIASFDNYIDAYNLSSKTQNSFVRRKGSRSNIYENIFKYSVFENGAEHKFSNISEAYLYADKAESAVYDNDAKKYIYKKTAYKGSHIISGVPLISQYPQLYRGCEITSLCMLLNYNKINVDKMTLASEIYKDNTPYSEEHGIIKYANPNIGFVGDIYSKENKGYGVYHKPIYNLLKNYCPSTALDITGTEPRHMYYYIDKDCPVWVVVNSQFKPLPNESFEKWHTSEGEILITYSEHSVLLIGYDDSYVYFNDPMHAEEIKKAPRKDFEGAWKQMGSQAVTVYNFSE